MRYEMMFPHQLRQALKQNRPAVLPVGVLEYHAEHCVLGVDTLLVIRALELLEKELDLVLFPPFYYGAASYVVEPPENNGTVQVGAPALLEFARPLFASLLRVGFRNIHLFIHHQSENFADGMPTDLAFKLAARQATFEFLEKQRGENWWGDPAMRDYYQRNEAGANPFNWIRVHPFMSAEAQARYPIDHAGRQETSLMLAFCPEGVDDTRRRAAKKWYSASAGQADLKYGRAARRLILDGMRRALQGAA